MYRFLVLFLLFGPLVLSAQQVEEGEKVRIEWSDTLEYHRVNDQEIQILRGHVRIQHDSAFLFCEEAEVLNQTEVRARGEVIIVQGDSLNVFADSLFYSGKTKKADLWGDVVLKHNAEKLFTDSLHYDLDRKVAYYEHRALLTNDTTQLRSLQGSYFVERDEAVFRDSVSVIDPEFELKANELRFNTRSRKVFFEGPTLLSLGEDRAARIYCEDGFYDLAGHQAEFAERPQYSHEGLQATARLIRYDGRLREIDLLDEARITSDELLAEADTIRYEEARDVIHLTGDALYRDVEREIRAEHIVYDRRTEVYTTEGSSLISEPPTILRAGKTQYVEETGMAVAYDGVLWQDTSAGLTIACERAEYLRERDLLLASGGDLGRPLLIVDMDGDSLYLSADTLFAHRADTSGADSSRVLHAYRDVRIFKSDLQAACDSLVYLEGDSLFDLFGHPVLWFDTTQLTADTVNIQLSEQKVHHMKLRSNAILANSSDMVLFNQISGRTVDIFFEENEPRELRVDGNVEALYYLQDEEKRYIGLNRSTSAELRISFENRQIRRVYSLREIEGEVLPMQEAMDLRLEGFRWQKERRPLSVEDVFTAKGRAAAIDR